MAKLYGRWGSYKARTPEEKSKTRRQEQARREAKSSAAEWLEKTRWCTNGCGKEAARYEDSPGRTLRYSGACSPECEATVSQRETPNASLNTSDIEQIRWLDRTLIVGPRIAIVTNQDQLYAALKAGGCEPVQWDFNAPQCGCISHKLPDGGDVCLLAVNPEIMEQHCSPITTVGILVHEVVHIFQQHRESMVNSGIDITEEDEAYSIQNLTITVLNEYSRLRSDLLNQLNSSCRSSAPPSGQKRTATVRKGQNIPESSGKSRKD